MPDKLILFATHFRGGATRFWPVATALSGGATRFSAQRRSEYGLLTQQELVEEAEAVVALALAHKSDLGGANIKPANIAALGTEVEAYRQSLPVYKVAVENAKVGGKTVRLVFKDNNAFIADDVRSAIELLADDYPTAYQRLLEALRIDDPSTRRKKPGSKPTGGSGDESPA